MFGSFGYFLYLYIVTKIRKYEKSVCKFAGFVLQRFDL